MHAHAHTLLQSHYCIRNKFFYVKSAASPEPKGIWIVSHPMSIQAELDQLVNLTCEVSGDPPITYQWTRDGVVLPGEILPYILIQEVKPKHRGTCVCVATNGVNSTTSQPGLLSFNMAHINEQPSLHNK